MTTTIQTPRVYLVGGSVRNHLMGKPISDVDFAVEAESYGHMREYLMGVGVRYWQERPEFVTARGMMPPWTFGQFGGALKTEGARGNMSCDFTLCRAESMYHDHRHPSTVTPASLWVDLDRRDFTINAIALNGDGICFDPHNGRKDIKDRILRTVGNAEQRFDEDPLRIFRGIRFAVLYGLTIDPEVQRAFHNPTIMRQLKTVKIERVREELNKALKDDWYYTMQLLTSDFPLIGSHLSSLPDLWFKATQEGK